MTTKKKVTALVLQGGGALAVCRTEVFAGDKSSMMWSVVVK